MGSLARALGGVGVAAVVVVVLMLDGCMEPDRTVRDAECVQFCADYPPAAALTMGCVCATPRP